MNFDMTPDERKDALEDARESIEQAIESIRQAVSGSINEESVRRTLIATLQQCLSDENEWIGGGQPITLQELINDVEEWAGDEDEELYEMMTDDGPVLTTSPSKAFDSQARVDEAAAIDAKQIEKARKFNERQLERLKNTPIKDAPAATLSPLEVIEQQAATLKATLDGLLDQARAIPVKAVVPQDLQRQIEAVSEAIVANRGERDAEYIRRANTPVVGGPATLVYPKDRYPMVVTSISKSGMKVTLARLQTVNVTTGHHADGHHNGFPVWDHVYTAEELVSLREPTPREELAFLSKKDGRYYVGKSTPVDFSQARYHRDFSD